MNNEIKKITRSIYITIILTVLALSALFWLFSRSFVTLKVSPVGSKVTVDNAPITVSTAGIAKTNVTPGLHTVKVESDNYIGTSQDYNFKRGFLPTIQITLKEMPAPTPVSQNAKFLVKGNEFNDGYYLSEDGKTIRRFKVGFDDKANIAITSDIAITDAKLSDIQNIVWSPSKDLAIFQKSGNLLTLFDFMKYDFVHQTEALWAQDAANAAWAPDNAEIAYYYAPSTGERSLIFADRANSRPTRVANLNDAGIVNPLLRWSPDSRYLLVIPRDPNSQNNKIYLFDSASRSFKVLVDSGNQTDGVFSPDGNQIIYSTLVNGATSLFVMNQDGTNQRSLDIQTALDKVAWEKDSKHIIVAQNDSGTGKDFISQFDTSTKSSTGFILQNLDGTSVRSLYLSDDNKMIIYENDKGIFAIKSDTN